MQSYILRWLDRQDNIGDAGPIPAAPIIHTPIANQTYIAPATIQIKVQHDPNYSIVFEFQRMNFPNNKKVPVFWYTKNIVPGNLNTNNGITTGNLSINETGNWRVRAKSNSPNAPWSEWTKFVVDTLNITPLLSPNIKP